MAVMSVDAGTVVTITIPTGKNIKFTYNNVVYSDARTVLTVTIGVLEVLQIVSTDSTSDLSGTRITATNNIAVFAGAQVIDIRSGSVDHMMEQMTPISTYGKEYVVVPMHPTGADSVMYTILSGEDGLQLPTVLDAGRPTIGAGQTYPTSGQPTNLLTAYRSTGLHFTLDKAALVAQFTPGTVTRAGADPSYFLVPAVDQWKTEYFLSVPSLTEFKGTYSGTVRPMSGYLVIVVPKGQENNVIIDGYKIAHNKIQTTVQSTNTYSYGYVQVSSGTHHLQLADGKTTFAVYAYGLDESTGPTQQCTISFMPDVGLAVKVIFDKCFSFVRKSIIFIY